MKGTKRQPDDAGRIDNHSNRMIASKRKWAVVEKSVRFVFFNSVDPLVQLYRSSGTRPGQQRPIWAMFDKEM